MDGRYKKRTIASWTPGDWRSETVKIIDENQKDEYVEEPEEECDEDDEEFGY